MTMVLGVDHEHDPSRSLPDDDDDDGDDNDETTTNTATTNTTNTTTPSHHHHLDMLTSQLDLLSALTYFPPLYLLAQWQYDLNLRRAGTFDSRPYYLKYI